MEVHCRIEKTLINFKLREVKLHTYISKGVLESTLRNLPMQNCTTGITEFMLQCC